VLTTVTVFPDELDTIVNEPEIIEIERAIARITEFERGIDEAKGNIQDLANSILKRLDGQDYQIKVARILYWNYRLIKSDVIAAWLHIGKNFLTKTVGSYKTQFPCQQCGKPVDYTITSRNDFDNCNWKINRERVLCDTCADGDRLAIHQLSTRRQDELQSMAYAEYLLTPEWDAKRRRALSLAGHMCQHCFARDAELHVHHLNYNSFRGEEKDSDLTVLCKKCHRKEHGIEDQERKAA
jgi:hypothetical protein